MTRSSTRAALLSAAALIAATPAWAQQTPGASAAVPTATTAAPASDAAAAPAMSAGDIVVTARQRNERLIDVPVAVTAIGAADIARYGANSLQDIAQMAPQVTIAKQASGSGSSFVIRGIGSSTLDTGFDQSVSINVDGLQNSRGRSLQQSYFDIAQVEILKGPQALFFGKNSPAGVISVTSANPTRDFSAGGHLGYDFVAHEIQGEGYVSVPITPTFGARFAASIDHSRGWMENVPRSLSQTEPGSGLPLRPADKWGPRERDYAGRLTLAWNPSTEFSANLKVTSGISKDNGEGTNGEIVFCGTPGVVRDGGTGQIDPYADCAKNRKVSSTDLPPEVVKGVVDGNNGKSFSRYVPIIASLTANWNPDNVKITSVTGYYQYHLDYFATNFAKTIYDTNFGSQREHYRQFSQEVRALTTFDSPLNFLVGAYFEDTRLGNQQSFRIADLPADPISGEYTSISKGGTLKGRTYSLFGQAIYKLADNLELAGGVRWTREQKDVTQQNTYVASALAAVFPAGIPYGGKYKDDNFSPEATITWHPSNRTTLYAAYKTGYKSGGFGLPALLPAGTATSDFSFGPETVKGGEVGAKGEFLGGRLTVNSAVYLYDYKGLQVDIFDGTKITYQIFNAGAARSYGAELDARFAATREISLRGALGYNHSRYTEYSSACSGGQTIAEGCNSRLVDGAFTRQDLAGAPTVRAPDWSGSIGVSYDRAVSDDMKIGLSTDVSGTSKYFFSETEGPGTLQKGYFKIDAALRLYRDDNHWSLALIGKNLTDHYIINGGSDRPGSGSGTGTNNGVPADILGYIDRPREIMLQVGFKF
jgi:iron complex outermembrane receptor protein